MNTIGLIERTVHKWADPAVLSLSNEQKELRLKRDNTIDDVKRTDLQRQRNKLKSRMRLVIRELENDRLDKLAEDVDSLRDGAKMFRAVKALVTVKSPDTIIKVDDCIVVQPVAPKAVAKYFSSMLNKPEKDIITETQATGALHDSITPSRVQEDLKILNNNRAAGPDAIPG